MKEAEWKDYLMAMTSTQPQLFPKQNRIKPSSRRFWVDAETQMNQLIEQMDNNPIPSTPVTRTGASIASIRMTETQNEK